MEYHEAVSYLASLRSNRPKLGTETTAEMLDFLGNPHDTVDYVQVAGSNGKGSTASMVERILRESGLDVGLYTSPDLNDLRERVRLNGRKVPKEYLVSFVERIRAHVAERAADGDAPTRFEVLTVLALDYFGRQGVDVAVLEVGIGGRYDATSVVDPVASAVTSVSLEHTDILGDTVEEIARDKAQVAPDGVPLVTGATGTARSAIRDEADIVTVGTDEADIVVTSDGLASPTEEAISIEGPDWRVSTHLPLLGTHQATNAGIAATLASQVVNVDERTVRRGLRRTRWPGRFEIMETNPYVVLDGAHNPDACSKLATLVDRYEYDSLHLVFGALRDKDHAEMVRNLPSPHSVTLCRPDVGRSESPETLERIVDRWCDSPVDTAPSVLDGVERAVRGGEPGDFVLVTGSLYTVSEARDRWTRPQIPKHGWLGTDAQGVLSNSQVPDERAAEVRDDFSRHTIKTYCRPSRAERIEELMLSIGGTAAVSAVEGVHQHVDVVLTGTRAQFSRLVEALDAHDGELSHIAAQLRSVVGSEGRREGGEYPWGPPPSIMGILNVTPDSFHDGGEYNRPEEAVRRAESLIADGADILDVGGESTRPGAEPVSVEREINRVVPVVERLAERPVPVSVDTRKAAVAEAALEAGADVVNDVSGLEDPEMRHVVAEYDVPVVLMHSVDAPVNPDRTVTYDDVVEDVLDDLTERILLAERTGIDRDRIVVDPGVGFGKTAAESFELVQRLGEFRALGCPILVGHSRKSLFESVGCEPGDSLVPTVATTALATERGADIVRVHDVAENAASVRTTESTIDRL